MGSIEVTCVPLPTVSPSQTENFDTDREYHPEVEKFSSTLSVAPLISAQFGRHAKFRIAPFDEHAGEGACRGQPTDSDGDSGSLPGRSVCNGA